MFLSIIGGKLLTKTNNRKGFVKNNNEFFQFEIQLKKKGNAEYI